MQRRHVYVSFDSKMRVAQRLGMHAGICAEQLTADCSSSRPGLVGCAIASGASSTTASTTRHIPETPRGQPYNLCNNIQHRWATD